MAAKATSRFAEAVYEMVKLIPHGHVATYSQVGTYLGSPGLARAVGNALGDLGPARAKDVPWHRVIKSDGSIAVRGDFRRAPVQKRMLKAEGVAVDGDGRVPIEIFGWAGPRRGARDSFVAPRLGGERVRPARAKARGARRK